MLNKIRLFLKWIWRIVIWLFEARIFFYIITTIPAVLLIFYFLLPDWESRFRISGMVFEVLGLSTVALGVRQTRQLFGRTGFFDNIIIWIKRCPKYNQAVNITPLSGSIKIKTHVAGIMTHSPSTKALTLEERVEKLEKVLHEKDELLQQTNKKIDELAEKTEQNIDVESQNRTAADKENSDLIKEAASGGILLESIGIFWILFGIVFATASEELVCILFCQ